MYCDVLSLVPLSQYGRRCRAQRSRSFAKKVVTKKAEEKLKITLNNIRYPIFTLDKNGKFIFDAKTDKTKPLFNGIFSYESTVNNVQTVSNAVNVPWTEFNEENNFAKLRRAVKSMHDRLLLIDKTIFKGEGD